jgi:hypothetical protein
MTTKRIALLASSLVWQALSQGQDIIKSRNYPQNYFVRPMDIAPQASGSFRRIAQRISMVETITGHNNASIFLCMQRRKVCIPRQGTDRWWW